MNNEQNITFADVEQAREQAAATYRKFGKPLLIAVAAIFGFGFLSMVLTQSTQIEYLFLPFIGLLQLAFPAVLVFAVIFIIKYSKVNREYVKLYKQYFVRNTLAHFFTDIKYNHALGVTSATVSNSGMRTGDRLRSNDMVQAKYKNMELWQADLTIEDEYTDSDGDTHTTTVFKGRWMCFDFGRKFHSSVKIVGKNFGSATSIPSKKDRHKFESEEFNKMFYVYSKDGVEAFTLVDPAFMEKLMELGQQTNYRIMAYAFGTKLYMALNNGKDSMEPTGKISKPLNEQEEVDRIAKDIKIIIDIIELLKINKRIFD